ncbi:MAG: D-glycerate dehydrogenase [Chloroflexi bacterium]|nr:D-glycerate dehydrogenase [Chloroflexota bacterium]
MQINRDNTSGQRPLIVFTTCYPWIKRIVAEVQPPDFDVRFLEISDDKAVETVLPQADFLVCLALNVQQAHLLRNCKLVMHNGVGYDDIALETLRDLAIPFAITPAMTPEGVAEHTLMLILALYKQLPAVQQSMRRGEWNMFGWREGSHNLAGKTLGIVGLGRIGKRVAHLAYAFGCQIIYNDIVPMPRELERSLDLQRVDLDTLLTQADIITLHVPLTELTEGMIGAAEFDRMSPQSLFINTSRGKICDLDALYDAVVSGHLLGAGIDVYLPEPPPPLHPILQLANVICTPHIASGTVERQYAINRAQFANCQRVLAGEPPHNLI